MGVHTDQRLAGIVPDCHLVAAGDTLAGVLQGQYPGKTVVLCRKSLHDLPGSIRRHAVDQKDFHFLVGVVLTAEVLQQRGQRGFLVIGDNGK